MDQTTFIAWWGAIVATIVFVWDIYKWKTDGAKLDVQVTPNMQSIGDPRRDGITWVSVTVTNMGSRPSTIKSIGMFYYKSWFSFIRNKPDYAAIFPNPNDNFPLPRIINPGEEWIGLVPQDRLYEGFEQSVSGRLTIWLSHSQSKKTVRKLLLIPK